MATEIREDLSVALEGDVLGFPNYVVPQILPWFGVPTNGGDFYYQPYRADGSAQYDRNTATIGDITATALTDALCDYTCKEVLSRQMMSYDRINGNGGKDKAELAMARKAKREFYNKIEALGLTALMTNATDITDDPVAGIDRAVASLQDKAYGETCLVLKHGDYVKLKNNATVKSRMQNTGIVLGQGGDARKVTLEQMASIFGVSKVIEGRDDLFASYAGKALVCILPTAGVNPDEEVQLGRSVFYRYNNGGDEHFELQSFSWDEKKAEVVDAVGKVVVKVLNSDLCKCYTIFDEGSTSASI